MKYALECYIYRMGVAHQELVLDVITVGVSEQLLQLGETQRVRCVVLGKWQGERAIKTKGFRCSFYFRIISKNLLI